jgi:hypothetical protein
VRVPGCRSGSVLPILSQSLPRKCSPLHYLLRRRPISLVLAINDVWQLCCSNEGVIRHDSVPLNQWRCPVAGANFTSCPFEANRKSAPIVRANAKTPIVSRSDDRTFYLSLLDGPLTVHSTANTIPNRAVLVFCYSLDPLGISRRLVQVTISTAQLSHGQVMAATESAADCLAQLLAQCQRLEEYYFLRHSRLSLTPD